MSPIGIGARRRTNDATPSYTNTSVALTELDLERRSDVHSLYSFFFILFSSFQPRRPYYTRVSPPARLALFSPDAYTFQLKFFSECHVLQGGMPAVLGIIT